jgi:hypothetical protein
MKENKNISFIKLQDIVDYKDLKLSIFVYPSVDFCSKTDKAQGILCSTTDDPAGGGSNALMIAKCKAIDRRNLQIAHDEFFRLQSNTKHLYDRGSNFKAQNLLNKYSLYESFHWNICDFFLKTLTQMYYKNLYLFYNKTLEKKDQKLIIEGADGLKTQIGIELGLKVDGSLVGTCAEFLFGECSAGRNGDEFIFDKCYEKSYRIAERMIKEVDKIVNEIVPITQEKAIKEAAGEKAIKSNKKGGKNHKNKNEEKKNNEEKKE